MQTSCARATLTILLCTLSLCSQKPSALHGADTPTVCCFSYTSRPLQRRFVVSYFETSSQCSKPGIIFQTKRGHQVCANPSKTWVQDLICYLEKRSRQPGGIGQLMRLGPEHQKHPFTSKDPSPLSCW